MGYRPLFALIVTAVSACGDANRGAIVDSDRAEDEQAKSVRPAPDAHPTSSLTPFKSRPRSNSYLQLVVTEAGFDSLGPPSPEGQRRYTVGLRGMARTKNNQVEVQFLPVVFAQNQRGCISEVQTDAAWLPQRFGSKAVFTAAQPTEGHLSFLVPDDTERIRVLVAPAGSEGLIVPVGDNFEPSWPAPVATIEDGSTLRILVLPPLTFPSAIGTPSAGREYVALDFVIENLQKSQGIEFTTSQQLRLVASNGTFVHPSTLTQNFGCRLDDGDVVPPGHSRRLMVAYDMPAGEPRRLNYRGFEVDEVTVNLP